jgi:hypothetical protein
MNKVITIQSGTRCQILSYFFKILTSSELKSQEGCRDFFRKESEKLKDIPGNGKLYKGTIKIL